MAESDKKIAPTEIDTAELNEKYESYRREIDELKRKIQQARKRRQNTNGILRLAYDKRVANEKLKKDAAEQQQRQQQIVEEQEEEENKEEEKEKTELSKLPNELSKLQCKLTEYKKLSGHGNKVYGVDFHPDPLQNDLVSVGRDGKLIFWNSLNGYKRLAYPLDTEFIMTLTYSPSGSHVACGGLDDILSIFEVKNNCSGIYEDIEPEIYKSHTGYISCIQYINNNRILTSSGDSTIREWDIEHYNKQGIGNQPIKTYKIHREDVMSISINKLDKNQLLSGSVDSTAKIIDLRTSKNTHSYYMGYDQDLTKKNRTTDVNVVKWFPEGNAFVAGCDDGTVRLFDIRSNRILNEYSYHKNYLHQHNTPIINDSIVRTSTNTPNNNNDDDDDLNPNDNNINNNNNNNNNDDDNDNDNKHNDNEHKAIEPVKASDDEPDFEDDIEPTDGVATLDFSHSGAFMFVSYNNDKHKVLAWNMLTGDVVQELKHDGHVPSLVVSPDGTKLVTACWDHHLKLWS